MSVTDLTAENTQTIASMLGWKPFSAKRKCETGRGKNPVIVGQLG
jgi:hypothetical protein